MIASNRNENENVFVFILPLFNFRTNISMMKIEETIWNKLEAIFFYTHHASNIISKLKGHATELHFEWTRFWAQDILKCFKQSALSYHIFRWKLKTWDRLNKVKRVVEKEIRDVDDLQLCDRRDWD